MMARWARDNMRRGAQVVASSSLLADLLAHINETGWRLQVGGSE